MKQRTEETESIEQLLRSRLPAAQVDAYRHNSASIRVRIVDERFRGRSRIAREEAILPILNELPEETLSDITVLLLLTTDELAKSPMNLEFEDPIPSAL